MALDLLQLTTAFSGLQLAVMVAGIMELRSLRSSNADMKKQSEARDARIAVIDRRVSHISGRLGLTDNEENQT